MIEITFDSLPKAVTQIFAKLETIENLLLLKNKVAQPESDEWFDLNRLCNFLPDKPAKQTVYGWVHTGMIPCHKGAKKLRFLKSEIDN